jgi:hypothetical protein
MAFDKEMLVAAAHSRYVEELKKIELFVNFYNEHKTGEKHRGMNIFEIGGEKYLLTSFDALLNFTMIFTPLTPGKNYLFQP